ncbi:MAG: Hpt domain-containing protein [Actinobacteria bacterium]|nr:Hpt domain-containing protein [Actinomycetota bacterium]
MTDAEFFELFRDEANGRLDNMVGSLLALESGRAAPDAVDALFRDAHSIKGGASMLGLDDLHALAHAIEDILEGVREERELPVDLTDTLLRAVDAMRRQLAGEEQGAPELLDELARRRAGIDAPAAAPEPIRRTIRVAAEKIDLLLDLVGESILHRRRLEHVLGDERVREDPDVVDELDRGERLLDELKDAAISMRTLPLASITGPFPRAVRDIARAQGKEAELSIVGADTELDRVILESLSEPLAHLLRNAVAHGIEPSAQRMRAGKHPTGLVELRALQRGSVVEIVVADDGRGVPPETLARAEREGSLTEVLTAPGFSTATTVTELSGRGVGLDVVKRHVESFTGSLEVRSEVGKGTSIVMLLPLALALLEVLLVERGRNVFGIPLGNVEQALAVHGVLPALPLAELGDTPPSPSRAVVVAAAGRKAGFLCDRLLGQDEVVVKPLGPLLARVRGYLGAAILGDGRVALLLDPAALVARAV